MDTKQLMKVETGPLPLLRQFQRDFDSLFARFGFDRFNALDPARAFWVPDVEIFERGGELVVRADVPGMTKDEIKIEITDEELVIEGERKQNLEEKKDGFFRSERSYGSFYRAMPLPEGVKVEQAKATVHDGVLEVKMPMARREERRRRLEIQETTVGAKADKHAA
jgi:HSP20 family protein